MDPTSPQPNSTPNPATQSTPNPNIIASNGNDADPATIPVSGPKLPTAAQVSAVASNATAALNSIKKNFFQQWQSWVMIGCGVVAIIGIICGVLGFSAQVAAEAKVAEIQKDLDEANSLLVKYGSMLGIQVNEYGRPIHGTPIDDTKDDNSNKDDTNKDKDDTKPATPATIASSDYIYIGEWGIKIKIPKGLKNVSYMFENALRLDENEKPYTVEVLRVSAILDDMTSTPQAFQVDYNSGLGALGRSTVDPSDSPSGATSVMKIGDYYYSYAHPQAVSSTDEQEQEQELKVVALIQKMLTTKSYISEF